MERLIELGNLLDCYGALLTERQRSVLERYACENLSLQEIAETENITRQGVRDLILRAETQLREYERLLGLMERDAKLLRGLRALKEELARSDMDRAQHSSICSGIDRLTAILEDEDGI